jgi:hypothetical protein
MSVFLADSDDIAGVVVMHVKDIVFVNNIMSVPDYVLMLDYSVVAGAVEVASLARGAPALVAITRTTIKFISPAFDGLARTSVYSVVATHLNFPRFR